MRTGNDAASKVIAAMESLEIDFFLAGSFSSNYYGIVRSTNDADFVAILSGKIDLLALALGPEFELDPQTSFEGITGT